MMAEEREWIVNLVAEFRSRNHLALDTPLTLMWDAPSVGSTSQTEIADLAREHAITLEPVQSKNDSVGAATSYLYATDSLVTGDRAERFARDMGIEGGILDLGVEL